MNDDLIGLWKMVSAKTEDVNTGELDDIYGPNPIGYLLLAPGGRMMAILSSTERSGSDPAAPFANMMAYSGMYHVDGDRWVTDVDIAWFPAWVGSQQERFFSFEDGDLHVRSTPLLHPRELGRRVRAILHWHRETTSPAKRC